MSTAPSAITAESILPLLGIGTQKEQQVVPDMGKLGSFDFDYDQMIRDVKGAKTTEDLAALNTKYGTDLIEDINVYDYAQGGRIGYAGGGGSEDPMLEEMYEKYVAEMTELGIEPMPFRQFKEQAMADK